MQLGFSKDFLQSGDLRVFMALASPGTDKQEKFEELVGKDGLIVTSEKGKPVLSYNGEAVEQMSLFHEALRNTLPAGLPPTHALGTCILTGSGASLDVEFMQDLHSCGVPVIAMGNSISLVPFASYWIGYGDILGYHPAPIERHDVIALVRRDYYSDMVWDPVNAKQVGITPSDAVATLPYDVSTASAEDFFADPKELSSFGMPCTFTVALCFAASLGFTNIILNGVDLGGDLDNYFAFNEIPYQSVTTRKEGVYKEVIEKFPGIYEAFWKHCVRISAVNDSPLDIPVYPKAYLKDILKNTMALSRKIQPRHSIAVPAEEKRKIISMQEKHRTAIVSPVDVLAAIDNLIRELPEHFDVETVHNIRAKAKDVDNPAGCVGCAENALAKPLYAIFEGLVVNNRTAIEDAWRKAIPAKYVVQPHMTPGEHAGTYIFRSDMAEEEQAHNEAKP